MVGVPIVCLEASFSKRLAGINGATRSPWYKHTHIIYLYIYIFIQLYIYHIYGRIYTNPQLPNTSSNSEVVKFYWSDFLQCRTLEWLGDFEYVLFSIPTSDYGYDEPSMKDITNNRLKNGCSAFCWFTI